MKDIIIATRGSRLALWQAEHIAALLKARYADELHVTLNIIKTKGDIIVDVPLAKVGGKGLFVKEIEDALLNGSADIAVHSMKDVPMQLPEGLYLGTVPAAEDPTDTLLAHHYACLADLPEQACVGTSSLRRQAQILALRPDLRVESLRGNVDTRLRKLAEGQFDAIVMATAAISRLGLSAPFMERLEPPRFVPAVAQGALGIEFAKSRTDLCELLSFMEHEPTRIRIEAERAFLAALDGGCQVPIAGHAIFTDESHFELEGLVAEIDGSTVYRQKLIGTKSDPQACGRTLANTLLQTGAGHVLRELYANMQLSD